jgi:hypothetical protein
MFPKGVRDPISDIIGQEDAGERVSGFESGQQDSRSASEASDLSHIASARRTVDHVRTECDPLAEAELSIERLGGETRHPIAAEVEETPDVVQPTHHRVEPFSGSESILELRSNQRHSRH